MRLQRLRASEYRQFAALDLALPDAGVIGLVGRNGSGKSTVLEAIRFVLFGAEACRTTKDGVRRTGAEGPCWAELTLASATHGLVVARRELDGDAKVTVNGHLAARAPRGVTAYCKNLFGMDERTWGLAIECPQKQLDGAPRRPEAPRRRPS